MREPFTAMGRWTGANHSIIAGGRTGNGLQLTANAAAILNFHSEAPHSEYVTCGFAFRTASSTGTRGCVSFLGGDGAAHIALSIGTTGALSVRQGAVTTGTIRATSAVGVIINDTWQFIEMQVRSHPLLGFAIVRVNGSEVININTVDLQADAGFPDIGVIRFGDSASPYATQIIDDLYLAVGEGESFRGDTAFATTTEGQSAGQQTRVGFAEPGTIDWYRSYGQTMRVGFLPGVTEARVGHVALRVLRKPVESPVQVSAARLLVLRGPGTPTASGTPPNVKVWTGAAFVDAPLRTWASSWFQPSTAVKTWNGTAWV